MKRFTALMLCLFLSACASPPPVPDWLLTADAASNNHSRLWLAGRDKLAAGQLAIAREAVSRTGDASLMARIELRACATQLASLHDTDCPGFQKLANDAGQAENVYASYLQGQISAVDSDFLPEMQRNTWRNPENLKEIKDPLSRLLAAAVLFKAGRLEVSGIELAIETAAEQGWRRALLAWLGIEQQRLLSQGESVAADAIHRRMQRVLGTEP
jgi:hypothetical protein